MAGEVNLFEKYLFEAPDESPPDVADTGPPDMPDDAPDSGPPDLDAGGGDIGGDDPPEMGGGDFGDDGFGDMGGNGDGSEGDPTEELELDDKISAILNLNLHQRFLAMLNKIANQLTMLKNNADVLHTLSPESLEMVGALTKLDENIHLYLKNSFDNENFSKNRLFFDKCLNYFRLLKEQFGKQVKKGIRSAE